MRNQRNSRVKPGLLVPSASDMPTALARRCSPIRGVPEITTVPTGALRVVLRRISRVATCDQSSPAWRQVNAWLEASCAASAKG